MTPTATAAVISTVMTVSAANKIVRDSHDCDEEEEDVDELGWKVLMAALSCLEDDEDDEDEDGEDSDALWLGGGPGPACTPEGTPSCEPEIKDNAQFLLIKVQSYIKKL